MTETAVENDTALLAAHERALRNTNRTVVTDEGLIRNVTVTYNAMADRRRVTVRSTVAVRRVDRTSVGQPPWVRAALANRSGTGQDGAD